MAADGSAGMGRQQTRYRSSKSANRTAKRSVKLAQHLKAAEGSAKVDMRFCRKGGFLSHGQKAQVKLKLAQAVRALLHEIQAAHRSAFPVVSSLL